MYIQPCSLIPRRHATQDVGSYTRTANWDNQLIKGSVLKTKGDHMTSPFLRIYYMVIYYDNLLGMCVVEHYKNMVHGQSGSIVPRSPGSRILGPCGHGQIFRAAWVWHGMLQALVLGHSSEQLAWQEQLGPVSSGLPVLQVQQMWATCVVQVQVMQVVPLWSRVMTEPAVWQWCHLGQCQLLWHCIHGGVSACSGMWNHCWCILDSCSMGGCISQ